MQDASQPVSRARRRWMVIALLTLFVVLGVTHGERLWTAVMYEWRPVRCEGHEFIPPSIAGEDVRRRVIYRWARSTSEHVIPDPVAAGYGLFPRWGDGGIRAHMLWSVESGEPFELGTEFRGTPVLSPSRPVSHESDQGRAPWVKRCQTFEAWWVEVNR